MKSGLNLKIKISNGIDKYIISKMAKTVNKLPWINSTIQKLIRKRDKAYTKFQKFRSEEAKHDLKVLKNRFKKKLDLPIKTTLRK